MQLSLGLSDAAPPQGGAPRQLDAAGVLALLGAWQDAGWLRLLDLQFARFLHAEKPEASGMLLLAAALTSHQLGRGHVCLELAATLEGPDRVLNLPPEQSAAGRPGLDRATGGHEAGSAPLILPAELLGSLTLTDWEASLHPDVVSDGSRVTPLVYENGRLYLYRYWRYERQVAGGIAARLQVAQADPGPPVAQLRSLLDALFQSSAAGAAPDWQRIACALAARQSFSIITGGPGTGKTTTVVRLLAMLQALHFSNFHDDSLEESPSAWKPLRIRLAAPTGKAAARLGESIAGRVGELPLEEIGGHHLAQSIPTQVTTLHKLLGGRPHVRKRTYNAENPLPLDVLVVDEASMVSLSQMADVIAALPSRARLILIGDKDQLSSVEAGAVLGELCRRAGTGHYLPSTAAWLAEVTDMHVPDDMQDDEGRSLDQAVAMLRFSHRFDGDSGIGRLAAAVNEGRVADVQSLLDAPTPDLACIQLKSPQDEAYASLLEDGSAESDQGTDGMKRRGYGHYLRLVADGPAAADAQAHDEWAIKVLKAHREFQVLCVLRNGRWGVQGLNESIARILHARGLISAMSGWYAGRPVMVTRNNPALRLTNGDIGVVLPYPTGEGQDRALRVAFPDGSGEGVRWFAPNRLDDIETVHALTVHKSQGSEFRHTALVLPESPTPVLTRELIYTGITRASHWFTLVNPGGPQLLKHGVSQRVYRSGGLGDLLAAMG